MYGGPARPPGGEPGPPPRGAPTAGHAGASPPDPRDCVDLHPDRLGQRRGLYGGAGRLVRREVLRVHLVHRRKIGHVDEIHRGLYDQVESGARGLEDHPEVLEHLVGLLRGGLAHDPAALGVERDLPRRIHHPVHDHCLAVGADRLRGALRHHDAQCLECHQKSPSIVPSGCTRIFSAAGVFDSPGMVMMSPASATTNPAPAEGRMSRTWSVNPLGAPSFAGSSEKEYCVFAMQTGVSPRPMAGNCSSARSAGGVNATPPAPYISFAMVSIFSRIGRFSSYSGLNFALRASSSLSTASATATPPSPPFSHTSHSSTPTPSAAHSARTASSSASVSVMNRLRATTTGTPNFFTLRMWRRTFVAPRFTASTSAFPSASFFTPPCILSARTVATTIAASGLRPAMRHLMSKNFSAPKSAPNPASVRTTTHRVRASLVATTELQPWAMFPNDPQWMKAGPPSSVWTKLGLIASLSSSVMAPWAFRSLARTGFLSGVSPTMMRARRCSRSSMPVASALMAMISEPGMITNRSSRAGPAFKPPSPTMMLRRARSFMSMVRGQVMRRVSRPSALP